jgi:hypothetical protein
MKKVWEIFMPSKLLANYYSFANAIKIHSGIDSLSLSYHPSRVMNSEYFIQKVVDGKLDVSSIDTPDVVGFFDKRMMREFRKKQSLSDLMNKMKNHIGWRLMNLPYYFMLYNEIKSMNKISRTKNGEISKSKKGELLIRVSSNIIENLYQSSLDCIFKNNNKWRIAVEIDCFDNNIENFDDYISDDYISSVEMIRVMCGGIDRVGISLNPAHLLQGQAMGKWGDPMSLLDAIKKSGFDVFSLDYDPVEILDQKQFDSENIEWSEEALDEVVKLHTHPDRNIIDYSALTQRILELFGSSLEEISIELNPVDLANPGEKFYKDIKRMAEICQDFERR